MRGLPHPDKRVFCGQAEGIVQHILTCVCLRILVFPILEPLGFSATGEDPLVSATLGPAPWLRKSPCSKTQTRHGYNFFAIPGPSRITYTRWVPIPKVDASQRSVALRAGSWWWLMVGSGQSMAVNGSKATISNSYGWRATSLLSFWSRCLYVDGEGKLRRLPYLTSRRLPPCPPSSRASMPRCAELPSTMAVIVELIV
jgi:hypothetical protein